MKDNFVPELCHTADEWLVVTDPTDMIPGERVLVCINCGEIIKSELIPMLGAPVVRVEAEKDSVSLGELIRFSLTVDDGVAVDKVMIRFDFDSSIFELVEVEWLVEGDVHYDIISGIMTITFEEPQILSDVLVFSLKAKTMADSFVVSVNANMALGDSMVPNTVLGDYLNVNPCMHTDCEFSYVNGTYHGLICKTCGATSLAEHEYSEQYTYLVSEANCESGAVYAYGCACGDYGDDTFVVGEPGGHKLGEYSYNYDATYTEDGTATAYCVLCGAADTIVVEGTALGIVNKFIDEAIKAYQLDNSDMVAKYEAIVEAMQTYAMLTETEKAEVEESYRVLLKAINEYNFEASSLNSIHNEARDLALGALGGMFALLPVLLWILKKRFMM